MMDRILGLDYGTKTVGVAVSDALGLTAQPLETITRKESNKLRKTCARIEALIREYDIKLIVIGYPKHMNNDEGDRCNQTVAFKEMIERRTGLPVLLEDERLTTVSAQQVLKDGGVRREDRKTYVDRLAASLILQTYLDRSAYERQIQSE